MNALTIALLVVVLILQTYNSKKNMSKLSQLNATLNTIRSTFEKGLAEVIAEIQLLKDQAADADLPVEVEATVGRLAALAAALDDLNPDAPDTSTSL